MLVIFLRINRPHFTHFKQYSGKSRQILHHLDVFTFGTGSDSTQYGESMTSIVLVNSDYDSFSLCAVGNTFWRLL